MKWDTTLSFDCTSFNPTFAPFQPRPTKNPTWNPRVKTVAILGTPTSNSKSLGYAAIEANKAWWQPAAWLFYPAISMDSHSTKWICPPRKNCLAMTGGKKIKETRTWRNLQHHQSPTQDFVRFALWCLQFLGGFTRHGHQCFESGLLQLTQGEEMLHGIRHPFQPRFDWWGPKINKTRKWSTIPCIWQNTGEKKAPSQSRKDCVW